MKKYFVYFTFLFLLTQLTARLGLAAEPAFEGYYKFLLGGQHSGYVVQRFEIDDKKKEMTSMYYVHVKTPTGSTTESLVAKSDLSFEPLSYQYSAIVDGKAKFVDATFKNKKMSAKMVDGTNKQNVTLTVPPNGFMSTFLNYVMLKNGLMVGKRYEYFALTEESPACPVKDPNCIPKDNGFIKGNAHIKEEKQYKGVPAYVVEFTFKGIKFDGFLSQKGETLGSYSPLQDAATEIVRTREEAVANFPFKEQHIKMVFGNVPAGIKNALYETKIAPATKLQTAPAPAAEPKKGVGP